MGRADDQSGNPGQSQDEGHWQYKPAGSASAPKSSPDFSDTSDSALAQTEAADGVEWTASEFVAHDKGPSWYALLILAALGVAGVIYIITKDIFSTVVVLILAIILAVAAGRKPRVLTYRLDDNGITAGSKFYPYANFKSFAFLEEEPFASIVFIPMKRFGMPFSVYLAPEDEQKVLGMLSQHLPLERGELDSVDRFMRRVRF
jgi:hypothetical protein